jgi:hypothetical protein
MNPVLWLRVSSVISLLFAAGHSLGGRKDWSPFGETEVLKAMRTVRFEAMGVSRTYLDFYRGFGHSATVSLLLQAILLWQIATIARTDPHSVRPLIASFVVASAAGVVISWVFILPAPAVFSGVLTVCLALAFFAAG